MISTLKTDQRLIERRQGGAGRPLTHEELFRRKISFVFGNLPSTSTITREMVEKKLKENAGFR